MPTALTEWSLILLCLSLGIALGGGLYEHFVLTPIWSKLPPSSFAIIQRPASTELSAQVARWTRWTWLREPLDIISFVASLLALHWVGRA